MCAKRTKSERVKSELSPENNTRKSKTQKEEINLEIEGLLTKLKIRQKKLPISYNKNS